MKSERSEIPSNDQTVEAISVPFSRGMRWIGDGLAYFMRDPLPWMAAVVVFMFFMLIGLLAAQAQLALVTVAFLLVSNVFSGGFSRGCDAQSRGEHFRIAHLFACFPNPVPFIILSIVTLCALLVIFVILQQFEPDLVRRAGELAQQGVSVAPELDTLRAHLMLAAVPLLMALYFAPVLLALHRMSPLAAMQLSLTGVLRNLIAFLPLIAISAVLMHVAALSGGLLLIVVFPVLFATNYVAYKDIFRTTPAEDATSSSPPDLPQ